MFFIQLLALLMRLHPMDAGSAPMSVSVGIPHRADAGSAPMATLPKLRPADAGSAPM
jgi:hypothetical protein